MEEQINILAEPTAVYQTLDDRNIFTLIKAIREGIQFPFFLSFMKKTPFSLQDWANFLHISDRTMQRYKKENHTFDPNQSERIVQISILYRHGSTLFNSTEHFNIWLDTPNPGLGGIKPKSLLDSSFGINLLQDELARMEQGILA